MNLKIVLFEIKETVENQQPGYTVEELMNDLEAKHHLSQGGFGFSYNNLIMLYMKNILNVSLDDAKKVKRKWTKDEVEFMEQYIIGRQEDGPQMITDILEEAAQLLNRSHQSVN